MADPLILLQEYAQGRREITELTYNGVLYYGFGDVAYPHDAKTPLRIYNRPEEYYSIESILSLWKTQSAQHTAYVKEVCGRGIEPVTRVQRKDVIAYLRGSLPAIPDTDMLAPIPAPIPVSRLLEDMGSVEPERKKPKLEQEDKGQRIDKILDQSTDKEDASQIRDLNSELSVDKIRALRNRVKKNMKNIVKPVEDDRFPSDVNMPDASADSIGKILASKERNWKNRTTCLESQSKDFSSVLSVLGNLKARDSNANRPKPNAPSSSMNRPAANTSLNQNGKPARANLNSGYSRYDQEIFQKEPVADFQIETGLSFHGTDIREMKNSSVAKPFGAGGGLMQHSQNPQSSSGFSGAAAASMDTLEQKPMINGVVPHSRPAQISAAQQQQQRAQPQKRVSRTPIIIIPATGTALITIYNAMDILQDLNFISSEEKKKLKQRRENEVLLQRPKNGGTVPYRVVDNPCKLRDDEWERVVAVFVQGPAWQFKGWKWGGNPVEIFANIAAFHLKYEEQRLDPNVAKWSVTILSLSKSKRHLDKATLHKFWDILDRHIAKNKPHLRF